MRTFQQAMAGWSSSFLLVNILNLSMWMNILSPYLYMYLNLPKYVQVTSVNLISNVSPNSIPNSAFMVSSLINGTLWRSERQFGHVPFHLWMHSIWNTWSHSNSLLIPSDSMSDKQIEHCILFCEPLFLDSLVCIFYIKFYKKYYYWLLYWCSYCILSPCGAAIVTAVQVLHVNWVVLYIEYLVLERDTFLEGFLWPGTITIWTRYCRVANTGKAWVVSQVLVLELQVQEIVIWIKRLWYFQGSTTTLAILVILHEIAVLAVLHESLVVFGAQVH